MSWRLIFGVLLWLHRVWINMTVVVVVVVLADSETEMK